MPLTQSSKPRDDIIINYYFFFFLAGGALRSARINAITSARSKSQKFLQKYLVASHQSITRRQDKNRQESQDR